MNSLSLYHNSYLSYLHFNAHQPQANDQQATQEVELTVDLCGAVEYPVKAYKFGNLSNLALHFPTDEAALDDDTPKELFWIGLKGSMTEWKRQAVITCYESSANVADHEAVEDAMGQNSIL